MISCPSSIVMLRTRARQRVRIGDRGDLAGEGLGRGHADLRPGVDVDPAVGLSRAIVEPTTLVIPMTFAPWRFGPRASRSGCRRFRPTG